MSAIILEDGATAVGRPLIDAAEYSLARTACVGSLIAHFENTGARNAF
jgi:hypothetical protein